MMITTIPVVAFILARLDEDERNARDGTCINCGRSTVALRSVFGVTGYTHDGTWRGVRCPGRLTGADQVRDPEQVLRGVQAKRHILEIMAPTDGWTPWDPWRDVLGAMASEWSHHPDYRPDDQEWLR